MPALVIPRLNPAAGQRFSRYSFPEGQRENLLSATETSFANPTGKQKTLPKQREKVLTFSMCPFREGKTEVLGKGWGSGWFKNLNSPLRDSAGFSPVFTLDFAIFIVEMIIFRRKNDVKKTGQKKHGLPKIHFLFPFLNDAAKLLQANKPWRRLCPAGNSRTKPKQTLFA